MPLCYDAQGGAYLFGVLIRPSACARVNGVRGAGVLRRAPAATRDVLGHSSGKVAMWGSIRRSAKTSPGIGGTAYRGRSARGLPAAAVAEALEPRLVLAADPVISEFMASNTSTLQSKALNSFPDWVEI